MEKEFICQYCGKFFDSGVRLGGHKVHCEPYLVEKYGSIENFKEIKKIKYFTQLQTKKEIEKQEWDSTEHFCENCGKQFFEKYSSGRFCCKECARSFSSSKDNPKETKSANCIQCGVEIQINKRQSSKKCVCQSCKITNKINKYNSTNKDHKIYARKVKGTVKVICNCSNCGKEIRPNKSGMCKKCYSHSPILEETKRKQSETMKQKNYPRWHIHRNKRSFAEQFFETVLNNNNIQHQIEFQIPNQNGHFYSLDFLITVGGTNIDLEIDGKQHEYRQELDRTRDSFLQSIGYVVYRIPWNDIKNDSGKDQMKQKIDQFLQFYNSFNV